LNKSDFSKFRLINQHISVDPFSDPCDAVNWLVAVQSQEYASAKWALGLRLDNAIDADIELAFTNGAILRTHLLRPTWHFVLPSDIRWLLALTGPRVNKLNAFMYRREGLDDAILKKSRDVIASALHGGHQFTRDELGVMLENAGIQMKKGQYLVYILMSAELNGVICSGARRGNQFTYALMDDRVPKSSPLGREEALAELSRRYFMSRGPASIADFAKWSGLTKAEARGGLDTVKSQFDNVNVDGEEYWFTEPQRSPMSTSPSAYLLSVFDEYISGYKDYSAYGDETVSAKLRQLGNALHFIIVVDGLIAGTWRRELGRHSVEIQVNLFRELSLPESQAVRDAGQRYGRFLGVPVAFSNLP
jgi:hypothetical protein